jgi:hypothetical protein
MVCRSMIFPSHGSGQARQQAPHEQAGLLARKKSCWLRPGCPAQSGSPSAGQPAARSGSSVAAMPRVSPRRDHHRARWCHGPAFILKAAGDLSRLILAAVAKLPGGVTSAGLFLIKMTS